MTTSGTTAGPNLAGLVLVCRRILPRRNSRGVRHQDEQARRDRRNGAAAGRRAFAPFRRARERSTHRLRIVTSYVMETGTTSAPARSRHSRRSHAAWMSYSRMLMLRGLGVFQAAREKRTRSSSDRTPIRMALRPTSRSAAWSSTYRSPFLTIAKQIKAGTFKPGSFSWRIIARRHTAC